MKPSSLVRIAAAALAFLAGLSASPPAAAKDRPLPLLPVMTEFDPANFSAPVANAYFPLDVGTTWIYEAETEDGIERTTTTVTSNTPVIDGVTAIEVHDVVELEPEGGGVVTIEDTLDRYAEDNFGNVWYMGEDTIEYLYDDNWNPIGTTTEGSWTAGVDDAEPGIIMLADPQPGLSYRQEFSAGIAEDMAKVERLNAKVSVPFGDYTDALATKEWSPLEPGGVERKYYVAGLGLVLTEEHSGKTVREELVDVQGP